MHAVVRWYTGQGASQLFDELGKNLPAIEELIRGVPGFVSYSLIRMGQNGMSVTVCQDKAGADESVRVAREWIQQNIKVSASPPQVSEGDVLLQLS